MGNTLNGLVPPSFVACVECTLSQCNALKIVHDQVMITCGSLGMTISRYMYVRGRRISKHDRLV